MLVKYSMARRTLQRRSLPSESLHWKQQVLQLLRVPRLTPALAQDLGYDSVNEAFASQYQLIKDFRKLERQDAQRERQAFEGLFRRRTPRRQLTRRPQPPAPKKEQRRTYFIVANYTLYGIIKHKDTNQWDDFKTDRNVKIRTQPILKSEIEDELHKHGKDLLYIESPEIVYRYEINSYQIVGQDAFNNSFVPDIATVLMREAHVPRVASLEGVDAAAYENYDGYCVYELLMARYGKCFSFWSKEWLFNFFKNTMEDGEAIDCNVNGEIMTIDKKDFTMAHGVNTDMVYELCVKFNIPLIAVDVDQHVFKRHIPDRETHRYAVLCYYVSQGHMYLVSDMSKIRSFRQKTITEQNNIKTNEINTVQYEIKPIVNTASNVPIDQLGNYEDTTIFYNTDDLTPLYCELFEKHNGLFSATARDNKIKSISYGSVKLLCDNTQEVKKDNFNYQANRLLCEKLGIPFTNQSLSSLVIQYEEQLFRPKRQPIDKETREALIEDAGYVCKTCGNKFCKTKLQIDHVIPVSEGGTNDYENLQVLCLTCHMDKTVSEGQFKNLSDPTLSSYNSEVRDIMTGDLAKRWAFIEYTGVRKGGVLKFIDTNKMRRNILHSSAYDYPVFSTFDKPQPYEPKHNGKPGLFYVQTAQYFPMRGNGWYTWPMVDYCLSKHLIMPDEIKYSLLSSFSLANDYYTAFIDNVLEKFGDVSKLAINSFIGCMARLNAEKSNVYITTNVQEACYAYFKNGSYYEKHGELYFVHSSVKSQLEENRLPINHQILDIEAVELHKLACLVEKAKGRVLGLNTDCVICEFDTEKDILDISRYTWENGQAKYKFEGGKDEAYAVIEKMKGHKRHDVYALEAQEFNTMTATDDVVNQILDCGSVLVNGRAGTGKSTVIKQLKERLDADKIKYVCLAPTHKACRVIDGQTIHKFISKNMTSAAVMRKTMKNVSYVIVDEISMVPSHFYKFFITLKRILPHLHFVFVGDFEQLQPVNDRWRGDYLSSPALAELVNNNRIELTECKRSDDELFELCKDVDAVNPEDFVPQKNTMRHLAFTNRKRVEVNERMMKWFYLYKKKVVPLHLEKLMYNDNSQDVWLCKDMPVISYRTEKNWFNNEEFVIKHIKDKQGKQGVLVSMICLTNERTTIEIPKEQFQSNFYPGFCLTVHKSQGSTYDAPYTIHEWGKFDRRLKYVALSRATKKNNIGIN